MRCRAASGRFTRCRSGSAVAGLGGAARERSGRKKVRDFKIEDHGYMVSDYFQGCGISRTSWEDVGVGSGNNAVEAYNDAVEALAQNGWEGLPTRPRGINARMRVPAKYDESLWYICVYVK